MGAALKGRIRAAECLGQIVPDRWVSIRKRSFTKCFWHKKKIFHQMFLCKYMLNIYLPYQQKFSISMPDVLATLCELALEVNVPSVNRRTNHTFKILLYLFETQIIKSPTNKQTNKQTKQKTQKGCSHFE